MKNFSQTSVQKGTSILDFQKFEISIPQQQQLKGGDDIIITSDMVDY